jgi:hypothetical protein
MGKLTLYFSLLLSAIAALAALNAIAQTRDCRSIADAAERLKCFDQPKDCKTISDSAERLKCFDAQSSGSPAAAPAPAAPAAAAPAPAPQPAPPILKAEPPGGQLPHGVKVWIDDGSCPAGFIKQIVGGNVSIGLARERSCVPRP